jgi:hypothetical protein
VPLKCSVCIHDNRGTIDKLLAAGQLSTRSIAAQFGLSQSAVLRHANSHVLQAVKAAIKRREEKQAEAVAGGFEERLNETYTLARSLAERASLDPDKWSSAVGFLAQCNKAVETQGKAEGRLGEAKESSTLNWTQVVVLPGSSRPPAFDGMIDARPQAALPAPIDAEDVSES